MSFALPQSFKTTPQEKMVGLFVLFAIAAFIYLGTLKGGLTEIGKTLTFTTQVKQSYGITLGAPVKLSGVVIGEVSEISLLKSGKVAISIRLPKKYQQLYTTDSTLKIDSQFGFDTMLIGQGMIFQPGKNNKRLKNGDNVFTKEPQTLADLTKEFNLAEISKQMGGILDNIERITANLAQKENDINNILANSLALSQSLNKTSAKLPQTINKFENLLADIKNNSAPVFKVAEKRLEESKAVLTSSNTLMLELQKLSRKTEPSVEQIPKTLNTLNKTLLEIELLTKQLKGLWYLGGKTTDFNTNTNEILIPYYNNNESFNDLFSIAPKGDDSEPQQN
ncbi:MAG: hypothetical protein COB35_02530 [Gammaproteobacteria bacterium]|nr:MAG: hypothetical protein COB35_02530 [Gammaproteobacteria bacterium]